MKMISKMFDKETKKSVKKPGQELQEQVAQRAYELFERRGLLHGHDVEDWLEAERLTRMEIDHRLETR